MPFTIKNILLSICMVGLAYFSFLMLRIIYIYIPLKPDVAFLQLKQAYITIPHWRIAFYTHVFTSIFVLLAGFIQFNASILKNKPRLHRAIGFSYVINILLVTGPASLLMSFYANAGIYSRVAFILLAILWMLFTALALYYAIKKNFVLHKAFMIRSYALTLSAISLRLFKMGFVAFTDIAPLDRYRLIAWLGWVVNLCIAEYIIYHKKLR